MMEGREVTCFPSYGAEIRGGTANCTVILSDALIGSPVVSRPDILIVMNDASLCRFLPRLRSNGLFFYDSSLITAGIPRNDIEAIGIPATAMADSLGNTKSANMVALGGLIAKTGLVRKESAFLALGSMMKDREKDRAAINQKAIQRGMDYLENTEGKNIRS